MATWVIILISVISVVALVVLATACYRKIPSNQLLVKYGAFIKDGFLIRRGGGVFMIPFIQGIKTIDLGLMNQDVILKDAYSANKIPVNLTADVTFKVSSVAEEQKIVAEALMSSGLSDISKIATEIISGELRAIVAKFTIDEINTNREKLKEAVSVSIEKELSKIGLDLKNLNLKTIMDTAGVLEEMGKKSAAEIKNQAMIDVAEENKKGRAQTAQLEAETIKSEKDSEVFKSNAVLNAAAEIEKQKAETNKTVRLKEIEANKEAQMSQQAAIQAVKTEEAITATKQADLRLETLRAEQLVDKKIENEKEILDNETNLKIKTQIANNDLEIAKSKAEAVTIAAKADSEAIKMQAEAKADLLALPKIKEAEAVKALNEALAGQPAEITNYLLQLELIKVLPQLVAAEAEALKSVGFKEITIIGGSSGTDGINNTITNTFSDVLKAAPMMGMMMKMMDGLQTKVATIDATLETEKKENN